jgi:hypothetical protein
MDGFDYPRPQLVRERWRSLSGDWQFTFDDARRYASPGDAIAWDRCITVPFAPEAAASGVADQDFHHVYWYRREFSSEEMGADERCILHFGAVDYQARVWVSGVLVAEHEGGHTPFSADITEALAAGQGAMHELVVRAEDDPDDLSMPRGKQDCLRHPHSIWYPRTTGIWQTVWLEPVAATHIKVLRWTPHFDGFEIGCEIGVVGALRDALAVEMRLWHGDKLLANDTYMLLGQEANLTSMQAHRNAVEALYHLTRMLDGTRPVVGNDGWEASATDILGIHDYDPSPERIQARYEVSDPVRTLFDQRRPGGHILTLDGFPHRGQPIVLTEFGGIAFQPEAKEGEAWGYSRADSAYKFFEHYRALLRVVNETPMFCGFCYNQFADTFQEVNGLLDADRSPKIPLEKIHAATINRAC